MLDLYSDGTSGTVPFVTFDRNARLTVDLTNLDFDRIVVYTCRGFICNDYNVGARVSIATTPTAEMNTVLMSSTIAAGGINTFYYPGINICNNTFISC